MSMGLVGPKTYSPTGRVLWEGLPYIFNDGGRADAGYKGSTGDCVVRSITIATQRPYQEVYDGMRDLIAATRLHRKNKRKGNTPRDGVPKLICRRFMEQVGWKWFPTMAIGQGCKVHLRVGELPAGRLVVSVSKHLCAVIDGVIYDTHDPSRDGTRCVYGYWKEA